jgi:putative addiction module CopG family antidote
MVARLTPRPRNMTISLTAPMVEQIRSAVAAGEYGGISEVCREALRGWALKRQQQAAALNHKAAAE